MDHYNRKLFSILILSGIVPTLNFIDIKTLELEYLPNSPEQLLIVVALICLMLKVITLFENIRIAKHFDLFIDKVGNFAYFHFMVHALIIHLISFLLRMASASPVLSQIIVILFTTYVTVYLVLPIYKYASMFAVNIFRYARCANSDA